MVAKLMKHDFIALLKIFIGVGSATLVLSIVSCIFLLTDPFGAFTTITLFMAFMGIVILVVSSFVASITQFYKSLFTGEGYLTFSLPATPSQILISKLLSAIVMMVASSVVAFVCVCIIFAGFSPEAAEVMLSLFQSLFDVFTEYIASDPLLAFEAILLMLSTIPLSLLFFFLVMSLAQLFTNHRKLIAVAGVIIFYWIISVFSAYCYNPLLGLAGEASTHLSMWIQIIVNVGLDVGMFFATRYIIMNKVNLIV